MNKYGAPSTADAKHGKQTISSYAKQNTYTGTSTSTGTCISLGKCVQ